MVKKLARNTNCDSVGRHAFGRAPTGQFTPSGTMLKVTGGSTTTSCMVLETEMMDTAQATRRIK